MGCLDFLSGQQVYQLLLLFDFLRCGYIHEVSPAPRFIKHVDGLVGKGTVSDVTLGQADARFQRIVGISHIVMILIFLFDVLQDLKCLIGCRRFDHDFLESAFERTILFNAFAVFVDRCGSDALQIAPGQSGFEHIGGIHRTWRRTCTDNGVYLIDEKHHLRMLLQFEDNVADTLFKLATILRSSHDRRHVERNNAFATQRTRHFFLRNEQGQPFDDGTFSDAGLADEHRIVLFPAAQDLCDTFYLFFPADDGVQFPLFGRTGHINTEPVKHWRIGHRLPCGRLGVALRR